jgi:hypothetical protein
MGQNKAVNMAHIADLMAGPANNVNVPSVGLNNYIARALSPQPSSESVCYVPLYYSLTRLLTIPRCQN